MTATAEVLLIIMIMLTSVVLLFLYHRKKGSGGVRFLPTPDHRLRERLEKGEISRKEYEEKMARLTACG